MIPRSAALVLGLVAATAGAAERPVRVAFSGAEAQDPKTKSAADAVAYAIAGEISRSGRAHVTAGELAARGVDAGVLRGCPSAGCQALADTLDADYVLLVTVSRLGRRLGAELRLVDPSVLAALGERAEVAASEAELVASATAAAKALLGLVPARKTVAEPIAVAPAEAPRVEPPPPAPVVTAQAPSRWPGILTASAGGAAAIGGTVLAVTALGYNQAKSDLTFDEAQAARASAQARLTAGYALIGAGAAALGVGLWMALRPGPVAAALVPAPGGGTVAIAGSF